MSRLYRKAAGREAKLSYMRHAVMENRHGLAVAGRVTQADGTAERRTSETMLRARRKATGRRIPVDEDKAYDTAEADTWRRCAIDGRTTRHPGYHMSQTRRAKIECIFGWGQATRHDAQNQASRDCSGRR